MSRRLRWLLLASLPLASAAAAATAAPAAAPAPVAAAMPTVVVLSWDGVRHDHPDRTELPGLARMARQGVRAGRLIPVFPTNTFPTHVSLATGAYPDRHGIVDNQFIDRARPRGQDRYNKSAAADWIEAEPLWIAAERQGVPAATYFWVGSESDWRGRGTRYREAPFDGDRPEADKVDRILAWLALPPAQRPGLIMSYWAGADGEGHDRGPDSATVLAALRRQDAELQRLLAGIDALQAWPQTTLIVVSDHGMTTVSEPLDPGAVLAAAGIGARVMGSAVAQVYLDDAEDAAAAEAALATLTPVRIYRRGALPAHWHLDHPTRSGDLTLVVDPPYTLSWPAGLAGAARSLLLRLGFEAGGHGYDARHPDMAGIFLALGRGVTPDLVLPEVQQIDLAATVARLLDIDPPADSAGRAIPGIGDGLMTRRDGHRDMRRESRYREPSE